MLARGGCWWEWEALGGVNNRSSTHLGIGVCTIKTLSALEPELMIHCIKCLGAIQLDVQDTCSTCRQLSAVSRR